MKRFNMRNFVMTLAAVGLVIDQLVTLFEAREMTSVNKKWAVRTKTLDARYPRKDQS